MVLNCNMENSGVLSSYCSGNISTDWSSLTGLCGRVSGGWFVVPLCHYAVKLKAMGVVCRHWSLGFLMSSSWFTGWQMEHELVWLSGMENFNITSIVVGSTWYTAIWWQLKLSALSLVCVDSYLPVCTCHCMNCLTCSTWLSSSLWNVTMSSTTLLNPDGSSNASAIQFIISSFIATLWVPPPIVEKQIQKVSVYTKWMHASGNYYKHDNLCADSRH